mmetsp:Transcript_28840/g.33171  ORF Transcript_28840/g.33171 Transcript_28840/m.33171 type:complete len:200 (+) Transcript_28840:309-908(+)
MCLSNNPAHTKPTMNPLLITSLGQIQPIALPFIRRFKKLQFIEQRFGAVPVVTMRHGATPDQSKIPVRNIRCPPPRRILRVGGGRLLQPVGVTHQNVFRGRFPRCCRLFLLLLGMPPQGRIAAFHPVHEVIINAILRPMLPFPQQRLQIPLCVPPLRGPIHTGIPPHHERFLGIAIIHRGLVLRREIQIAQPPVDAAGW